MAKTAIAVLPTADVHMRTKSRRARFSLSHGGADFHSHTAAQIFALTRRRRFFSYTAAQILLSFRFRFGFVFVLFSFSFSFSSRFVLFLFRFVSFSFRFRFVFGFVSFSFSFSSRFVLFPRVSYGHEALP